MKRATWTPERDAELRSLFAVMTSREVAAKMGLSLSVVENRIRRLSDERKGPDAFRTKDGLGRPDPSNVPPHIGMQRPSPEQEKSSALGAPGPSSSESIARAPAVHTSKSRAENYLCISDTQEPFAHGDAIGFCERVRREFSIPRENVIHVGDETDSLWGSKFPKDPDAPMSATGELAQVRERIAAWAGVYPNLRLCISNHGIRWAKKAFHAEIPSQLLRHYSEVIKAPDTWQWQPRWVINGSKRTFVVEHGHEGAQGIHAYRQKAIDNGMSTVHGHLHASAGIAYVETNGQSIWGMCVGSLIDREAFAFLYDKASRFKPVISVGAVLDGGRMPVVIPYG